MNWNFYREFHSRGMTLKALAAATGVRSHSHLSEVLNNKPQHGGQTRRKLVAHLTARELELLGWDQQGNLVPQGTLSDVQQVKTESNKNHNHEGNEAGKGSKGRQGNSGSFAVERGGRATPDGGGADGGD